MSISEHSGRRSAKLPQWREAEQSGGLSELQSADQQARYELASAIEHMARAIKHIDQGDRGVAGYPSRPIEEAISIKPSQYRDRAWHLLIGLTRIEALVRFGRTLLEWLPH